MSLRWNIFMTIAIVALGAALFVSMRYGIEKSRECRRLGTNQIALTEDIRTFRVRDSLNAASAIALTMTTSELAERMSDIRELVADMGIKLSRVESISQSAVQTSYDIHAPIIDSAVHHKTPHMSFDATISGSTISARIESIDTLTQVVHRIPKRLWFIRYGTRYMEQSIVSSNPNSRIIYDRYIKITR